ncbi:MAG: sigma-70 family RNA polymerase sigma factor [Cellulosilyticaceae bacterium]
MEQEMSITEMVQAYQQGRTAYSYDLWKRFAPLCTKWAYYTHIEGYDVDDFLQQSYLELVKCLEKYDINYGVAFEAYYKRHLYGYRANLIRKKREALCREAEGCSLFEEIRDETVDVQKAVETRLMVDAMLRSMKQLKPEEQALLIEHYIDQKSVRSMANSRDMKYKTVEAHIAKAKKKVKQMILEQI